MILFLQQTLVVSFLNEHARLGMPENRVTKEPCGQMPLGRIPSSRLGTGQAGQSGTSNHSSQKMILTSLCGLHAMNNTN